MRFRPTLLLIVIVGAGTMLTACERPFVAIQTPTIEVIQPDLGQAIASSSISIVVSASSFRDIESVSINGLVMERDADLQVWRLNYTLAAGLNELIIEAVDIEAVASLDTVFAMHAVANVAGSGLTLPTPRGAHTTTRLNGSGALLIVGGAPTITGPATDEALILRSDDANFTRLAERLNHARAGHTASLLPDGRVLIVGGATLGAIDAVNQLVETPEIYDPVAETFEEVPFRGDPIRRTEHTASTRLTSGLAVLDLFGGRGDIQYVPEPRLGTRDDIRTFVFRDDSLIAVSPAIGPGLGEAVSGHTQTRLRVVDDFVPSQFLVAGTFFFNGEPEPVDFTVDFTSELGILTQVANNPHIPRSDHAAMLIQPQIVALYGGRQSTAESALGTFELFSTLANRYYLLAPSPSGQAIRRFGHTATLTANNRILLIGGFTSTGAATTASEFVDFTYE